MTREKLGYSLLLDISLSMYWKFLHGGAFLLCELSVRKSGTFIHAVLSLICVVQWIFLLVAVSATYWQAGRSKLKSWDATDHRPTFESIFKSQICSQSPLLFFFIVLPCNLIFLSWPWQNVVVIKSLCMCITFIARWSGMLNSALSWHAFLVLVP